MATYRLQLPAWLATDPTPIAFAVALSSVVYRVRIYWDMRALPMRVMREGEPPQAGAWRMDLQTLTGAPILLGRKLVLTDDMWQLFHYRADVPPGRLQVRRTDGGTQDPGLYDLGGAVALEYVV